MWNKEYFAQLDKYREQKDAAGGEERIDRQHASGKLTARERVDILLDEESFVEVFGFRTARPDKNGEQIRVYPGDGVITGFGKINGRLVFVCSEDFTVNGGTLGEVHSKKICHIQDLALDAKAPIIFINDSGGARIEEGVNSIAGYSGMFLRNTRSSGIIPQIAVMLGPCAGGACYSPAICDFVFMSEKTSRMFVTGPVVVKASTREDISSEELGGAQVHATKSGVCHFVFEDDEQCLLGVRRLLTYLPQNNTEMAPKEATKAVDNTANIENIVPDNMRTAYDVRKVINTFVDRHSFLEVQKDFAQNAVIGLSRLDGKVLGIVANQPCVAAGTLDIDTSDKIARFIRFCDCFNIPILTLVDVPGYMPGSYQEHNGIIRHGAKILYAYSEATVPKIGLIMRKAFGGAYIAMNSKKMGADYVFAWPLAQIAVMGPEGAVDILYKNELRNLAEPTTVRAKHISEYEKKYLNPYFGAQNGYIDDVIKPEETRKVISAAFNALETKTVNSLPKKHGNIPL